MKHRAIPFACALCLLLAGSACAGSTPDAHILSLQTSRMSPYETVEALKAEADFILEGTCLSSEAVFQDQTIYTVSEVQVHTVFKGDLQAGDTALILEMGGRATVARYLENCNVKLPDDAQDSDAVIVGLDGYFPLQAGDSVVLFLSETDFLRDADAPMYYIVHDYEGKFYLREDGTYQRPVSSDTDTLAFSAGAFTVTLSELNEIETDGF